MCTHDTQTIRQNTCTYKIKTFKKESRDLLSKIKLKSTDKRKMRLMGKIIHSTLKWDSQIPVTFQFFTPTEHTHFAPLYRGKLFSRLQSLKIKSCNIDSLGQCPRLYIWGFSAPAVSFYTNLKLRHILACGVWYYISKKTEIHREIQESQLPRDGGFPYNRKRVAKDEMQGTLGQTPVQTTVNSARISQATWDLPNLFVSTSWHKWLHGWEAT